MITTGPVVTGPMIPDILTEIFLWFESATTSFFNSASQWMFNFGNGFFNIALKICSGFITSTPNSVAPEAWKTMKGYATGNMAIGIAEDLVIVFFLISIIEYAITVRSKVEPEDIMKMVARAFVAQFLVFNYMTILEGLWTVTSTVISTINPSLDPNVLGPISLTFGTIMGIIMVIMALVYMIMMIILGFKIITAFWQKYIWAFLMVPFGGPAFAVVVGSGRWNNTAKAYVKFAISIMAEFIAMAFLITLLGTISEAFRTTMMTYFEEGIGVKDNYLLTLFISYLSNICFAGMVAGMITKLDSQVNKMLGL